MNQLQRVLRLRRRGLRVALGFGLSGNVRSFRKNAMFGRRFLDVKDFGNGNSRQFVSQFATPPTIQDAIMERHVGVVQVHKERGCGLSFTSDFTGIVLNQIRLHTPVGFTAWAARRQHRIGRNAGFFDHESFREILLGAVFAQKEQHWGQSQWNGGKAKTGNGVWALWRGKHKYTECTKGWWVWWWSFEIDVLMRSHRRRYGGMRSEGGRANAGMMSQVRLLRVGVGVR